MISKLLIYFSLWHLGRKKKFIGTVVIGSCLINFEFSYCFHYCHNLGSTNWTSMVCLDAFTIWTLSGGRLDQSKSFFKGCFISGVFFHLFQPTKKMCSIHLMGNCSWEDSELALFWGKLDKVKKILRISHLY